MPQPLTSTVLVGRQQELAHGDDVGRAHREPGLERAAVALGLLAVIEEIEARAQLMSLNQADEATIGALDQKFLSGGGGAGSGSGSR